MPYDEIIPPYIQNMKAANRSERTIQLRLYHVRIFRKTYPGIEAEDVTEQMIVDMLANPAWKPNTKGAFRSSMTGFFGFGFNKGYLPDNPAKDLPKIKVPAGVPKPATEQQIAEALQKASPMVQLMIAIGSRVGARAMEIAQMSTYDVEGDAPKQRVRIVGKGDKTRIVPLEPDLAEWILDREPGYIFPGKINGHIAPATVSRYVSLTLPPGVTCHKLRHRFATVIIRKGGSVVVLQKLMGHASLDTTQGYIGLDDEQLRLAAEMAW